MRSAAEIGRANKAVGDAFEAWIDVQHTKAMYLGVLAHVVHNEAHSKIVNGRLIYTECGVSDYSGVLEGGKFYACEAKSTSEKRLYKSAISPKQQEHLNAVAKAGGLAFLLVEFRTPQGRHRDAIPWLDVPWEIERSAESICASACAVWAIEHLPPEICFLSRYHAGGPRSSSLPGRRVFARS